jgi:hypothetical protein
MPREVSETQAGDTATDMTIGVQSSNPTIPDRAVANERDYELERKSTQEAVYNSSVNVLQSAEVTVSAQAPIYYQAALRSNQRTSEPNSASTEETIHNILVSALIMHGFFLILEERRGAERHGWI